ncbi:hypothetical protein JJB11_03935 [Ramlibacter ginsenosidimutans]|uniref:Deaminase n=1 Tax=Ramlibacter ginsenosidimutans TaxID=502333 RepID=A0A934TPQ3_9BURK|nr:PP0621 family protein [Ramlibacter ginsenosidimutans]MBK6005232.1 hypothetical protein [Ramlibacter ginsenosidimutans]
MKYLVLFAVLYIAYLVWRNNRIADGSASRRTPPAPPAPQQMVSCAVCGLHLPQPDAVRGADGRFFCGQEHRRLAGG